MFVYLLINKINGKQYIGQTTQEPAMRWAQHVRESRRQHLPLYTAIRKYSTNAFILSILDTAETQEELNEKERDFIFAYNTTNRAFGYNLHEGGNKPPATTPETAAKIGKANRGKKRTAEERQRMSVAAKKRGSPWLIGVPKSAKTKAKIGAAHAGMKHTPEVIEKIRAARAAQKPIRWTEEQKQKFSALRKAQPTSSVFRKGHIFFPSKKTEGAV